MCDGPVTQGVLGDIISSAVYNILIPYSNPRSSAGMGINTQYVPAALGVMCHTIMWSANRGVDRGVLAIYVNNGLTNVLLC